MNVARELNQQFQNSVPGVLVHISEPSGPRPWTNANSTSVYRSGTYLFRRMSPANNILNWSSGKRIPIYGGMDKEWKKGGVGGKGAPGLVLRQSVITLRCAFPGDGWTRPRRCKQCKHDCVEGCFTCNRPGRWCDASNITSLAVEPDPWHWTGMGCAFHPRDLPFVLDLSILIRGRGGNGRRVRGYNEVVLDRFPVPEVDVVQAIFFESQSSEAVKHHARHVHATLRRDLRRMNRTTAPPLLSLDLKNWTHPFVLAKF